MPRQTSADIKRLLGTYANAYKVLQRAKMIDDSITRTVWARAMRGDMVEPQHADIIQGGWATWQTKYLNRLAAQIP